MPASASPRRPRSSTTSAELGVSHLYLSPILQAAPGSMHGYDVVDHTQVSSDLGGRDGLESLGRARPRSTACDLIVDVVPNHMSIPTPAYLNPVWWEVLRDGRDAEHAHWFDIDWELCDGRVGLPILGDPLSVVIEQRPAPRRGARGRAGAALLRPGAPARRREPPRARSTMCSPASTTCWRAGAKRTPCSAIGASSTSTRWSRCGSSCRMFSTPPMRCCSTSTTQGVIGGFRIDHPDGLADPEGYLEMLRDATERRMGRGREDPGPGRAAARRLADCRHDGVRRHPRDPDGARPPPVTNSTRSGRELDARLAAARSS